MFEKDLIYQMYEQNLDMVKRENQRLEEHIAELTNLVVTQKIIILSMRGEQLTAKTWH